ncbi:MAG: hypothetical protein EOO38_10265, partial [Cytophagaceae bacterium]
YIMASRRNGTIYLGSTPALSRRAWEHRTGVVPGFTTEDHTSKGFAKEQDPLPFGDDARALGSPTQQLAARQSQAAVPRFEEPTLFSSSPSNGRATTIVSATPMATKATAAVMERDETGEKIRQARLKGYEGDPCTNCGAFTMVRNGVCLKCDSCGETSGCS